MAKIIHDHIKLKKELEIERTTGKKIVFTNGSFDIIHVGHVRSLIDCKNHGDILIVAINSDESVRNYKGEKHPIIPENERMEIVTAFNVVNYVTIFSEGTANKLLNFLKPDVHAKGTDYTKDRVPERETVLSYGGRIAIVGDQKRHSTSELISTICRKFAIRD